MWVLLPVGHLFSEYSTAVDCSATKSLAANDWVNVRNFCIDRKDESVAIVPSYESSQPAYQI